MTQKLLITLLVFTTFCNAQIVNIPDANFKSRLLSATTTNFTASTSAAVYASFYNNWSGPTSNIVDTNGDGEIQVSEAQAIKCLNLKNAGIANLTGIEAFTNLQSLRADNNNLTTLNVTQNTALVNLRCEFNQLTSLIIGQNNTLLDLHCFENQLSTLVLQSTSLQKLYCQFNNINTLGVLQCPALQVLFCHDNNLTALDVSQCNSLYNLHCEINDLVTLNIAGCTALQTLDCHINNLTTLDLSNSPLITFLRVENNDLTYLNISQCVGLTHLECGNNQLTSLDVTPFTSLALLHCGNNQITSLDVSQCLPLVRLSCGSNDLTTLNLKNGHPTWTVLYFGNNPTLQYVCADEEDIQTVQMNIGQYPNCHVNTYCTFTPGGTFYELTGSTILDFNDNGCDATDLSYANLNYTIADGTNTGNLIANQTGDYYIPVGTGTFTITPNLENPSYFNISPPVLTVDFPAQVSPYSQNFCVTANGIHSDLEVFVVPVNAARPGFDAFYKIVYRNKGNQVANGTISFTYDDAILDYIISNPLFNSQSPESFVWNFSNLQPFEAREIELEFNVNGPTETPAVNNGDVLEYTAEITTSTTDDTPADNTFVLNQTVVGSYDPNDKTCLEGETVVPAMIGEYVHYLIRFENTGTYAAENIVVKDIIDSTKFELSTLIPLNSSHEFVTRIDGNKVEFLFEDINLPFDDANNDGYVSFKIKTKSSLVLGDSFSNSANIYFDYNYPILTDNYTTTIQNALGVYESELKPNIVAYPNPVVDILMFKTAENVSKAEVYDVAGRILFSVSVSENKIDLSKLKTGNYLIKIYTQKGIMINKIIKQ